MGQRLGRLETLIQKGISPIPMSEGVGVFLRWLRHPAPAVGLVVAGRFGDKPTLKLSQPQLPLRRFIERKRAYYPGIELVLDAELSETADPYLNDHVVQKQKLFPVVMALARMPQAAWPLTPSAPLPGLAHVQPAPS